MNAEAGSRDTGYRRLGHPKLFTHQKGIAPVLPETNLKKLPPEAPRHPIPGEPETLPAAGQPIAEPNNDPPPLIDPSVLEMLRADLDDDGVWQAFVRNFVEYLPHRYERLRLALTTGDLEGALDAVLSLKTSSQMVGAERLAGLALDLERSIRADTDEADAAAALPRLATAHLRQIAQCGQRTIHRLQPLP